MLKTLYVILSDIFIHTLLILSDIFVYNNLFLSDIFVNLQHEKQI